MIFAIVSILSILGLSLTALSPGAGWYFIFIVYLFSPRRAKKDTERIENDRQAKGLPKG
jgi:hypothetical protein